jgi:hypothetical protein
LQRLVSIWPDLPAAVKASILALLPGPAAAVAEADFDRAFDAEDRQNGGHNFANLAAVRAALAVPRPVFDALLHQLRRAGRYSLSAAEGRRGALSAEDLAAAVMEDGQALLWLSRRP